MPGDGTCLERLGMILLRTPLNGDRHWAKKGSASQKSATGRTFSFGSSPYTGEIKWPA
jgi:hypothetical protein